MKTFVPDEIIQIGCGGTGSRLVEELKFWVRGNLVDLPRSFYYTLVDFDTVGDSNLNRQLFYPWDLGKSKAHVFVERLRNLIKIRQIPEPINQDTVNFIFDEERLNKKLVVICSADNPLVVKQVMLKLLADARNDYLWIFTGASLVNHTLHTGEYLETGVGQAYAYGVVNQTPLFPVPPNEALLDIMRAVGYGPTSTGNNCGVTTSGGAQTPLMNHSCVNAVLQIFNALFKHGKFIPAIYFVDGVSTTYAEAIDVATLMGTASLEQLSALDSISRTLSSQSASENDDYDYEDEDEEDEDEEEEYDDYFDDDEH
jgi:hypothetical protein